MGPIATPVKPEPEAESDVSRWSSEAPLAKRQKFFHKINQHPLKPGGKAQVLCSADSLSDFELRECYNIANAGLTAQFARQMNPKAMEEFFQLVFQNWNTDNGPPDIEELDCFPLEDTDWNQTSCPVGSITMEGKTQDIIQVISLTLDPLRISMENKRLVKVGSKKYDIVGVEEAATVAWKSGSYIRQVTQRNWRAALLGIANTVASYNRKRAIFYARNFLAHQANGNEGPLVGRYTFASFQSILNALPTLCVDNLQEGITTVVVFGAAELGSGSAAKIAKFGNQTLNIA